MIDSQDEKIKVRDRIITVIDKMIHGGSSQKSIADKIGYSQNSLNDVINSRRHMPINKINEFIKHFHISRSYIYEGIGTPFPVAQQKERGNMVMEEVISYSKGAVDFKEGSIPYYEVNVSAGNVTLFDEFLSKTEPSFYLNIPMLGKCDFALPVSGISMMNEYKPGDIVAYKTIHDWNNYIEYGNAYLIVTESRNMLKYIRKSKEAGCFLLCSKNEKEGFDPFDIKMSDIRSIHIVVGKVEKKII